jgi:hypothetical protein
MSSPSKAPANFNTITSIDASPRRRGAIKIVADFAAEGGPFKVAVRFLERRHMGALSTALFAIWGKREGKPCRLSDKFSAGLARFV